MLRIHDKEELYDNYNLHHDVKAPLCNTCWKNDAKEGVVVELT